MLLLFILIIAYVASVSASSAAIQISLYSLSSGNVASCNQNTFISSSVISAMQCIPNPTSNGYITAICQSSGLVQITSYADAGCTTVGTINQYNSGCSVINTKAVSFQCSYSPSNAPIPILNMGPNTANPGSVLIGLGSSSGSSSCPLSLVGGTLQSTMYFPTGTCINSSNDPQGSGSLYGSMMFWCNGNSVVQAHYSDIACKVQNNGWALQYDIGVCYNTGMMGISTPSSSSPAIQVLSCNGGRSFDGVTTNTNTPPAVYMYEDAECAEVGTGALLMGGSLCAGDTPPASSTTYSYLFTCQGTGSATVTQTTDITAYPTCSTAFAATPQSITPNQCFSVASHPINGMFNSVKVDCGGGVGLSLAGPSTVSSASNLTPSSIVILIATMVMGIVGVFRL